MFTICHNIYITSTTEFSKATCSQCDLAMANVQCHCCNSHSSNCAALFLYGWVDQPPLHHSQSYGIGLPCPRNNVSIIIFPIHLIWLKPGVPLTDEVVKSNTAFHNVCACQLVLLKTGQQAPPAIGKNAKAILHHTASPGTTVVENSLSVCQSSESIRLNHPCPKGKCIIPDQEIWHVTVITGQRFRVGPGECSCLKCWAQT